MNSTLPPIQTRYFLSHNGNAIALVLRLYYFFPFKILNVELSGVQGSFVVNLMTSSPTESCQCPDIVSTLRLTNTNG